jgi:hypothetical protein
MPEKADRVLVLANLARAAAADGRREQYERAFAESASLLVEAPSPERASQVWLNLARAAASAGDHPRAEQAARRAVELAMPLRLGHIQLEVEALQSAIRAARAAGTGRVLPRGQAGLEARAEALAVQVRASLAGTAAP